MSETYTVYIENSVEKSERTLNLNGSSPMNVHKDAYMKSSQHEEIRTIEDSDGKTVFDVDHGFLSTY